MLASSDLSPLTIGGCRFDPRSHELWRDGERQRLPRRLSQLLLRLAQAAPDVVSRQQLIDEVWHRRMVEDDVLSRAVADLRRALGDNPKSPRFIETIPKTGYRLCAEVRPSEDLAATVARGDSAGPPSMAPGALGLRQLPWGLWPGVLLFLVLVVAGLAMLLRTSGLPGISASDMARTRPLTSGAGWEFRPDVSPDGRWVAYSESAESSANAELILQGVSGDHREVLEPAVQNSIRPAFSPDGRQLVFLRTGDEQCTLALRTLPGSAARSLAKCSNEVGSTPAWSADQKFVAYSATTEPGAMPGIAVVEVATGAVRILTRPTPLQGPDRDPETIPGRNSISFARGHDGEQRLMTISLDEPSPQPLELWNGGRLQGHAWRADGRQLIVASDQPGYRALVLLDATGRKIEVLGARGGRYPSWSASGVLVYESAQYDANIWRIEFATANAKPERVVASTRYDATPTLSADGGRLAFVSTRNDFEQIFIANPDGSEQVRLAMPDGQRWSRPAFRPRGSQLLVTGYDESDRHWIYRHDLASGRSRRLQHLGENSGSGVYTADGTGIVYLRGGGDSGRSVWHAATTDARAVEIPGSAGAEHFVLTGDQIVLSRVAVDGFRLLSLQGDKAPIDLFAHVAPITDFAWTVRGRHLYAAVHENGNSVLKRWNLDSRVETLLAAGVEADAVGPSLAVSPDETVAWFARTDQVSLDLMWVPTRTD